MALIIYPRAGREQGIKTAKMAPGGRMLAAKCGYLYCSAFVNLTNQRQLDLHQTSLWTVFFISY